MSAFNGSGTFVISGTGLPFTTNTTISSTVANQLNSDLATGLSTCITKDGQTTPTANIPMGGYKFTSMGDASASGNALNYNQSGARLASLGLGMAPTNILDITKTQNAESGAVITNASTGTAGASGWFAYNSSHAGYMRMHSTGFTTSNANRADGLVLGTNGAGGISLDIPSDAYRFYIGGTAYFTLTTSTATIPVDISAGHLLCNGAGGGTVTLTGFGNTMTLDVDGSINTTSGNGIDMVCVSNGVTLSNGATAWAAISDYRAKNVSGIFTNSGAIIDAVPVHLAALKETPDNVKAMFLAHEVQAAVPYAVHGEKDGAEMQLLESTDPLVPILWAELRSLRARLAAAGL